MKKHMYMLLALMFSVASPALAKDSSEIMIADYAKTPAVVSAMKELDAAFNNVLTENGVTDVAALRTKLKDGYYTTGFGAEYKNKNSGKEAPLAQSAADLPDVGVALQNYYIQDNAEALGSKHKLDKASDKSNYSTIHGKYHPDMRAFLDAQGLYDIFLYRLDGQNIYTCFKELDFARNVFGTELKASNLAEAVKAVADSTDPTFTSLVEMKPYIYSYELPARFVATGVYDGDKKIGVMVFQLPPGM